jgi:hypothetical protein
MGRQRPSTLQEFVDGMRLPITGALPAQKGELSGSPDETIALRFENTFQEPLSSAGCNARVVPVKA